MWDAIALLESRGAGVIRHPGGTLLAHLRRVHARLDAWGGRSDLLSAGMCHAFYGTDGFAVSLGDVERRDELAEVIGESAERLVYVYGCCDRGRSYPGLAEGGEFVDRFTGAPMALSEGERRDFAELTVANELDVVDAGALNAQQARGLYELFGRWRPLLSPAAAREVELRLTAPTTEPTDA
ncbi:hypothetical protein DZF91_05580 [Actinomadura logoneensis]|uniref:DUF6817 domain-containing protein n=1 Tax=Actinomadura logoneensis TaxID=2293572 RepID=A0A372JTB9_9ACTN|nr:hypothetical protein [Actinomadura logoneensis]RFU42598.1 hypothetical protein DZF91_05580 [Actinomadura logoneensis]